MKYYNDLFVLLVKAIHWDKKKVFVTINICEGSVLIPEVKKIDNVYLRQEANIPFSAIENGRNFRQLSGTDYMKDIFLFIGQQWKFSKGATKEVK